MVESNPFGGSEYEYIVVWGGPCESMLEDCVPCLHPSGTCEGTWAYTNNEDACDGGILNCEPDPTLVQRSRDLIEDGDMVSVASLIATHPDQLSWSPRHAEIRVFDCAASVFTRVPVQASDTSALDKALDKVGTDS